ncbi:MAG: STAS domain-containing protein [Geminicoccaceae bacterium]
MKELQSEVVDDLCRITLPRVLDIPAAVDLREAVLETVEPDMIVAIQSGAVEQVTTPGLQVLMAAATFVERKKARFTMVKPSDALIEGLSDLGLFSRLMAWNVE